MSNHWGKVNIDNLVEAIRDNQGECVFLIGAGCSFSSGIPLASGLISEIKSKFPVAYSQANDKSNYNDVMSRLTPRQRSNLLNRHIEKAKLNWAHLAFAQLFNTNKIDRILTTNFDPLIVKATALTGFFPAIYDLAVSSQFKASRIVSNSVFYLNGQHTGFVTLNTTEELEEHKARLKDIVNDTGVKRIWVVIGYSGAADPLLEVLAEIPEFEAGLYWIGFEEQPSDALKEKLLKHREKQAFYIGKQDADKFMTELAQKLECFPPKLLSDPFQHVNHLIEHIDFTTGGNPGTALKEQLDKQLSHAQVNQLKALNSEYAIQLLLAGKNAEVLAWYEGLTTPSEEDQDLVSWAYIGLGVGFDKQARALVQQDAKAAQDAWQAAGEKFAEALRIKPDMHEALFNWGISLAQQARALVQQDAKAAQDVWQAAGEKYAEALRIKPDKYDALLNWGSALDQQARALVQQDAKAAQDVWQAAGEKYAEALRIKPDKHVALFNWGCALDEQARALVQQDAKAAQDAWQAAGEKYAEALRIKPDMHEALNNWGSALDEQARALVQQDAKAAQDAWQAAGEKFAEALRIKPDMHEALFNWGISLAQQARALVQQDAKAAQDVWQVAGEKYAEALRIKPDKYDALLNWGSALDEQARALAQQDAKAAQDAWQAAGEKYAEALRIKPDMHEAFFNWGISLDEQARALVQKNVEAAQDVWQAAGEKYAGALRIKPDYYDALSNWCSALLSQFHLSEDAREQAILLDQAEQLMQRSAQINPNEAAYNLACAYALKKDLVKCIDYLEQSRLAGNLPNQQHIDEENDFKLIRNTGEFRSWYQSVFEQEEISA
jgi:hypothetical protein